jgi:uncharacterized protein (DUF2062 family)
MPREFLKHYLPDPHALRNRRELRYLRRWLKDPRLFHFNRRCVARATAIGLFVAFIPIPGTTLLVATLAILLRANLLIAVATIWITNPLTIPPVFYFCYRLGVWLVDRPLSRAGFQPNLEWFWQHLELIWAPFLLGCLIVGTVSAIVGYCAVHLVWRIQVLCALQQRRSRRQPPVE